MTRYVIDPPTLLLIAAGELTVHAGHQLVAPAALRPQALQRLFDAANRGELDDRTARQRHTALTETKIRVLGDRVSRWTAWQVAREQGWSSLAHAEYVAVARLQADALVATDPELAAAARDLVPLADPAALRRP
jgi:predicted nucleic acid-binding protein